MVHSVVIRRNTTVVIGICLIRSYQIQFKKFRTLPLLDGPKQNLIIGFVISLGLFNHLAVVRVIRQTHAKVISLKLGISIANMAAAV
ncbi:hypothetical protein D3C85_1635930 [compost metagenome]